MKNKHMTAFLVATAAVVAAGCIVSEQARYRVPGGGTGVGIIDRPFDALTVLEADVGGALHSGIKSSGRVVAAPYHFAAGLVSARPGPDLSALQKARRKDSMRRTPHARIIEKVGRAKVTVDAPLLDRRLLDQLGMYLVWDTALADVKVKDIWAAGGLILLDTKDTDTKDYKLFAVNLHNGFAEWLHPFLSPIDSRPTLSGDTIWVSSVSKIYRIDVASGSSPWPTRAKFTVNSPFFVLGNKQYVGTLEHAVYAMTTGDRYPDWYFSTFAPITATPIVEGHTLYVASEDGSFYAYNYARRDNLWQVRTPKPITSDPVHDENNVYFGSEDFDVYCVSKDTGNVHWKFPTQGPVRRPLLFLDENTLLVRADGVALYAIDKQSGAEKWHDADALCPVALGRSLYALTTNNTLKALNPETGEAAWEQSIGPFAFIPTNLATDAITLCTKDGQMVLIQEKNGMSLKPASEVARAEPQNPQKPEEAGEAAEAGD